jgi:hypothetical protein
MQCVTGKRARSLQSFVFDEFKSTSGPRHSQHRSVTEAIAYAATAAAVKINAAAIIACTDGYFGTFQASSLPTVVWNIK